jgi:5-methylcytosine-specific restriction enzyme subunit McrC
MESRIPVENLYYLLCYAWDRLDEGELASVDSEACETLQDLLAKVLIGGTQRLIKQGFHRNYQEKVEETGSLRGRIAFAPSLRQLSWTKGRMVCEFTELSYNTLPNRILKTTLRNLLFTEGISNDHKDGIAGLLHHLHEVSAIRISSKIFSRIQYHQNLSYYRFLMNICQLVHESLIPKEGGDESQFRDFLRDHQKMAAMFEDFVFNFYKRESDYDVGRKQFSWQGFVGEQQAWDLLPTLNTDVELSKGNELTILDCKFYYDAFTSNRDIQRFKTANLYQLYAYVMNRQLRNPELNISGMLLYPETGKSFCHHFQLQGHPMCIASVNLNQPWRQIHEELLELVKPEDVSPSETSEPDCFRMAEIINCCALRFDGYAFLEDAHQKEIIPKAVGFPELNVPIVKKRKLYPENEKNAAVFFALQRFLCKWGGEQLPESSNERIAFNLLYLHLYKEGIPKSYKHEEYGRRWERISERDKEAVARYLREQLS